jgi:hypothetical protein
MIQLSIGGCPKSQNHLFYCLDFYLQSFNLAM